jgi:hypothetical protein
MKSEYSAAAARKAAQAISKRGGAHQPAVAIILGSGLGGLASAIDDAVRADVAAAEADARAAPEPSVDELETQVWADGGSAWRN